MTVHYNPTDPAESTLRPGPHLLATLAAIVTAFFAFVAGYQWYRLFVVR